MLYCVISSMYVVIKDEGKLCGFPREIRLTFNSIEKK